MIVLFLYPREEQQFKELELGESVSLVPSQDEVLLALNPSALIKTRLTVHTERGWYFIHTQALITRTRYTCTDLL